MHKISFKNKVLVLWHTVTKGGKQHVDICQFDAARNACAIGIYRGQIQPVAAYDFRFDGGSHEKSWGCVFGSGIGQFNGNGGKPARAGR